MRRRVFSRRGLKFIGYLVVYAAGVFSAIGASDRYWSAHWQEEARVQVAEADVAAQAQVVKAQTLAKRAADGKALGRVEQLEAQLRGEKPKAVTASGGCVGDAGTDAAPMPALR